MLYMPKQTNSIQDYKKLETHTHTHSYHPRTTESDVHSASRWRDGSVWTECRAVFGWGLLCLVCCTVQQDNWISRRMPLQWWLACNSFKVRISASPCVKFSMWKTHTADYSTHHNCHITLITAWKASDDGFKVSLKNNVPVKDTKHDKW